MEGGGGTSQDQTKSMGTNDRASLKETCRPFDTSFDSDRCPPRHGASTVCSPRVYCGVVSALGRCGRAQDCREVLQSYKARGGEPLEDMYTSVITAFRYSRNVAAARQMLEELKSDSRVRTSIASYNAYLLVNAVAGILPGGNQRQILAEIEQAGLVLNRETYTALIMGQSSFEARMAMWEEMLKSNITPTIASAEEVLKGSRRKHGPKSDKLSVKSTTTS